MEMKRGQLRLDGLNPMELTDHPDQFVTLTPEQERIIIPVKAAIKAYLAEVKELVNGKYSHLRDLLPSHLASPGSAFVSCGDDGIVIRYEEKKETALFGVSYRTESLSEAVYALSQRLIRCVPPDTDVEIADEDGIKISLCSLNQVTSKSTVIDEMRILVTAELKNPSTFPAPPRKPYCLASIRSQFSIMLQCETTDESGHKHSFVTHTPFLLPAGWACIEVFPFLDLSQWIPANAPMWAEMDILAAAAASQRGAEYLQSLDPCASAREKFAAELKQFKALLDTDPEREEELQVFLNSHGQLICPSYKKMWSKLPMGKRVTDFVFCDATGEYLLVEIERSTLRLFIKSGDPSSELSHACSQVTDWKRYLQDNLLTVQNEIGLVGISPNPRSLVIIGRSASLTPENRRKLRTIDSDMPSRRILTYDDVYLNAKALLENMFGPLDIAGPDTQVFHLSKDSQSPFIRQEKP